MVKTCSWRRTWSFSYTSGSHSVVLNQWLTAIIKKKNTTYLFHMKGHYNIFKRWFLIFFLKFVLFIIQERDGSKLNNLDIRYQIRSCKKVERHCVLSVRQTWSNVTFHDFFMSTIFEVFIHLLVFRRNTFHRSDSGIKNFYQEGTFDVKLSKNLFKIIWK